MDLLVFKLVVTPALIVGLTLASRRWGPKIGGLITGLPLASAPVLAFICIEQGLAFGRTAALGILSGIGSVGTFCLVYAFTAKRARWPASALAGVAVYLVATAVLRTLPLGLAAAATITVAILSAVLAAFPFAKAPISARPPPRWDLPARAVTATAIVLALTAASPALGPRLSGLLAPFPAFALLLAAFMHAQDGPGGSILFLRGIVLASFASSAFFITVSSGLALLGLTTTLLLATFVALVVSGLIYRFDQLRAPPLPRVATPNLD